MRKKAPDLSAAYRLKTAAESKRLYADWAETYDSGFARDMSYELPAHAAAAFASADGSGPVLDVGAGTGLVGAHLSALAIGPIDGTDISPEMLEIARQKGFYRALFTADITQRMDVANDTYSGIISSGTFTLGHVGPDALDELLRIAKPGALFVITISDAHFHAAGFADKLNALAPQIRDLTLHDVPIYGADAKGDHAADTGKITTFWKKQVE